MFNCFGDMMHYGGGWGWWIPSTLVTLAFLGLLIMGIVWLVKSLDKPSQGSGALGDSAEEILRRRFAAGEIDADEYNQRLEHLRRGL